MDAKLLPKSIKILGKDIKIVVKEMEDNLGEFDSSKMTIYLDKDQSNEEAAKTLFHENCHVIAHLAGWHFMVKSGVEEMIVRSLEHGLAELYWLKPTSKK